MSHSIGFIGLGVMGHPMASHILQAQQTNQAADSQLVIHDFNRSRVADLLAAGANWADTPSQVAAVCDVVIVMVPTIDNIRDLLAGPEGLIAGTAKPWTLIVSSTCSAQEMRDLGHEFAAKKLPITLVDAPVSGGAEGAQAGKLSIMVGGDKASAELACAVLKPAGEPVHLGPLGAGQVAKACNQLIVAAEVVALAEASLLAERAGLDVTQLFNLMMKGYASSRVMEVKTHRFANHDHSPSGPAKFMIKDLRAVVEEAQQSKLALVSVDALLQVFTELTEAGLGDYDTSVVQDFIADQSKAAFK